jgi:hypothetical protein
MTKSLAGAIEFIQATLEAEAAINFAPDYPPEAASLFPFSVCFPTTGSFRIQQAGWRTDLHTLVIEIHYAQTLLAPVIQKAVAELPGLVTALVADVTLGGTVDTIVTGETERIHYAFGQMEYGGKKTVGTQLRIPVKIQT